MRPLLLRFFRAEEFFINSNHCDSQNPHGCFNAAFSDKQNQHQKSNRLLHLNHPNSQNVFGQGECNLQYNFGCFRAYFCDSLDERVQCKKEGSSHKRKNEKFTRQSWPDTAVLTLQSR